MSKPDGGPAFPNSGTVYKGGMSLRDYFAANAPYMGDYESYEHEARMRYEYADAMIAERDK